MPAKTERFANNWSIFYGETLQSFDGKLIGLCS